MRKKQNVFSSPSSDVDKSAQKINDFHTEFLSANALNSPGVLKFVNRDLAIVHALNKDITK